MPKENNLNKLRKKRVLITGGKGFLGQSLIPQLRKLCKKVYLYNDDIRDISNFKKKSDIVFHLAGFNKIDSKHKTNSLFDVNVNGTMAVMHYCYRVGASCIFASSSAVYKPTLGKIRLSESSDTNPVTLYGISKILAEKVCRHYSQSFKVPVISIRIFNMYGPGQRLSFITPYIFQKLKSTNSILLKSPQAVRDFVYISDVVRAFILSCKIDFNNFLPLNIGTGVGLSINNFVKLFASRLKVKKYQINKVNHESPKKDYVVADIKKAKEVLGWKPQITIEKGLDSIIASGQLNKYNFGIR
ncbi:MAG: NAD(P)-dependent oxidoreductase [Candidatus Omnitrophica bacterium]|nr:NAD(P)-dependent oxidoreductase [Candidatus Omnitrophota bacterium]